MPVPLANLRPTRTPKSVTEDDFEPASRALDCGGVLSSSEPSISAPPTPSPPILR